MFTILALITMFTFTRDGHSAVSVCGNWLYIAPSHWRIGRDAVPRIWQLLPLVNTSRCQHVTKLTIRVVNMLAPSTCHTVTLSTFHTVALSTWHVVNIPRGHPVTL